MKITKHILAACILTGMAACDTDKEIAVFNEDSGAIKINAVIDAAYTRSNPQEQMNSKCNLIMETRFC